MRKSYRKINPMRLKFAPASVYRKDERKPIALLISDQKLPVKKWIRFLRLPANFPCFCS